MYKDAGGNQVWVIPQTYYNNKQTIIRAIENNIPNWWELGKTDIEEQTKKQPIEKTTFEQAVARAESLKKVIDKLTEDELDRLRIAFDYLK